MSYQYSICHPDQFELECPEELLSAEEVRQKAREYPWKDELLKLERMDPSDVHYNPSLDFKNRDNQYSFCLTAEGDPNDFGFSVWYYRPVQKKVLFGLLGSRKVFEVIDKSFSMKDALKLLDSFLAEDYGAVENALQGE